MLSFSRVLKSNLNTDGITVNTSTMHFIEGVFGIMRIFEFNKSITKKKKRNFNYRTFGQDVWLQMLYLHFGSIGFGCWNIAAHEPTVATCRCREVFSAGKWSVTRILRYRSNS